MTLKVTNVVGTKSLLSFWLVKTKIHTTYQIEGKGSFYCHQISVVFGLKLKPTYRKLSVSESKPKPIPTYHTCLESKSKPTCNNSQSFKLKLKPKPTYYPCLSHDSNQHATLKNLLVNIETETNVLTHVWVEVKITILHFTRLLVKIETKTNTFSQSESKRKPTLCPSLSQNRNQHSTYQHSTYHNLFCQNRNQHFVQVWVKIETETNILLKSE